MGENYVQGVWGSLLFLSLCRISCLITHITTSASAANVSIPSELLDKARNLPRDIDWHFIGQLQSNKCRKLAEEIPNLWAVESVDASKKADALEKGRAALRKASPETPKLRVYVQVNTSGKNC
jgi:uncharacterized pyridoxal phosphate-containing UPF0001 family protein